MTDHAIDSDWRCDECGRPARESRLAPGNFIEDHSGTCSQNSALSECERCGHRHADLSFAEMLACVMEMETDDADAMAERIFDRALAGLPQEPTAARPRPTLKEQRAHLDEGSCGCHDSWDQCPCAEGGHPADGSCNCCSLGTGLCGPLPQEPTEGGER